MNTALIIFMLIHMNISVWQQVICSPERQDRAHYQQFIKDLSHALREEGWYFSEEPGPDWVRENTWKAKWQHQR